MGRLFDCYVCGATLTERQYQGHVKTCSDKHTDELRALRNHVQDRLPGPADPVYEAWVEENAEAIIAGRKRM